MGCGRRGSPGFGMKSRVMNIVTPATHPLNTFPFDSELTPGARNAVKVCLRVQPSEKVTVTRDDACREIAAAIVHELEKLGDRKSTRLNSSHANISYAVFCLKKKNKNNIPHTYNDSQA